MQLDDLRRLAVARAFAPETDLASAIRAMGYVQADPIRAPARAQDLILRHRVIDYRIDDLEKRYPQLPVVEDMLHNYGFFPREHLALLYPRTLSARWRQFVDEHGPLRNKLLRFLNENAVAHPRDVERALGTGARANGWGGTSSATTLMLEALHREGHAEVVRRNGGIKVYARARPRPPALPAIKRADGLIRLAINLYAPLTQKSLMRLLAMMGSRKPDIDYAKRIALMVARDELRREVVDGQTWIWPAHEVIPEESEDRARLLAPFDPLVWDRERFETFWGWSYRFEAYTPPAKRKLGYYALPMLWRGNVIGWANVTIDAGRVKIETGLVSRKPTGTNAVAFRYALAAEVERISEFLATGQLIAEASFPAAEKIASFLRHNWR